jgi:hypothetical protein
LIWINAVTRPGQQADEASVKKASQVMSHALIPKKTHGFRQVEYPYPPICPLNRCGKLKYLNICVLAMIATFRRQPPPSRLPGEAKDTGVPG